MASFTDRLDEWKPPSADDLDISLPIRREPKKEAPAEEPREIGQHGGGADSTPAEAQDDVAAAASEPSPQRDEPDEGEHTDSTQEQVAARAAQRATQTAVEEPEPEEVAPATPTVPAEHEPVRVEDVPKMKPALSVAELSQIPGESPVAYKRTATSYGADVATVQVKPFPQAALDKLRVTLAWSTGGEFAEAISAPALVTAFIAATIGLDLEFDENTAAAADAFRRSDVRLAAMEDKVDTAIEKLASLMRVAERTNERSARTESAVDALEFGVAYLVTDRVAGISTADTNETNVDVTQRKVLTARETIRERTKVQRTIETQREERSMA
jgi:hypothetical protein